MTRKRITDWEKIITEVASIEHYHMPEPALQVTRPPMYRVCLINDDFTPMDFVVHVLQQVFHKPTDEATRIMLQVHTQGEASCGIYTRDVAETKVTQVIDIAHTYDYPLKCIMCKDQEYVIKKS
jgi:ATP-dependent Clp protease adaptor protein ClpS